MRSAGMITFSRFMSASVQLLPAEPDKYCPHHQACYAKVYTVVRRWASRPLPRIASLATSGGKSATQNKHREDNWKKQLRTRQDNAASKESADQPNTC